MPHSRKVTLDGILFDSQIEAKRYKHLKACESTGMIQDLLIHPKFTLQERITIHKNTMRPKTSTQSAITYEADFQYKVKGFVIVEDVKGAYGKSKKNPKRAGKPIVTDAARLRHKLFKAMYPSLVFRLCTIENLDPRERDGYFY